MKRAGFTFVELMLAAGIFAIVAVVIYATFGTGISAWRKTETTQNLYQDVRLALDKVALDLENALIYSEQAEFSNFVGDENKISFYTLVDIFPAIPVHPEIRKVTYSLDEATFVLQRQELSFAESEQQIQEQKPEELAANIRELNFYYCYEDEDAEPPYQWLSSWDSAQVIPQGVKIELKLEADEELTLTKYVFIPNGAKGEED